MVTPPTRSRLAGLVLASLFLSLVACGGGSSGPDAGTDNPDGSTSTDGGTAKCGDGLKQGSEACDDGNNISGDGCTASCNEVEPGWVCSVPGTACTQTPGCGNGKVEGTEECDDRNTAAGDGCTATCTKEPGWSCPPTGGRCRAAQCGDKIIAGDEECEDGNSKAGDGCSDVCRLESGYKCDTIGQPCTRTVCGDKKVEGTEQCDDGNNDMGDGCSPLCVREPKCTNGVCQAVCGDGVMLPGDTTEQCDDGNTRANDGCSPTCQFEEGFSCKFIEDALPAKVEIPIVYRDFRGYDLLASGSLPRGHIDFENANGGLETGIVAADLGSDGKPVYAKEGVTSANTHGKDAFDQWYRDRNTENINMTVVQTLTLQKQADDSYVYDNQSFFPLDNAGWVAAGKESLRSGHNFSFTSEARYWFEYKGTEVLTFRGDDDVWVFINGHLAIDLGGVHGPQTDSITLSAKASALGLQTKKIYEVVVLQAERHTSGSSYRLTLNNFTTRRTECKSTCGDNIVDEGEQCDDGINDGGYGQCARGCVWGPRCGDKIVQSEGAEQCDDGNNINYDGCSATCKIEIN
ncbi:DUF4215 domain-containing protein [Vitiosangium sp. GDMCC 1.1324]|uniref:DUF4215 domain-containing protein n=1 Tax=Vitiosangium sp. (strain GDMCC 1.1324) TaxID=2138576 RepID=UPI000D3A013E|nr:DUF4215 domain-containing protein [Vitiosangium sp. GDMCC 1.1324]PTL77941.1 hypothetical protein DAT35_42145 [Vitiosangium sp. GDMCC 1.1324]